MLAGASIILECFEAPIETAQSTIAEKARTEAEGISPIPEVLPG
jgi:hypothetical protein